MIVAAFAASLLVGLVIMLWAVGGLRSVTAPAAIGGPFQLTDQAGQTVTEKNLKGKPTLIFFGFTHCPDVCPTSLFEISEVLKAMGKDADRVNAYFVSVDPERDTAAAMKDYLSSFDPHLKGLTGDPEAVAKVLSAYRVYAKKVPLKDGDYTMDHTALIYLMDRDGRFVAPFNLKRTPEEAADRPEAVSLSGTSGAESRKTALASQAGWSIRPSNSARNRRMPDLTAPLPVRDRFEPSAACWPASRSRLRWRLLLPGGAAHAQTPARPAVEAAPQAVPGFWDPRRRPDRPDMSRLTVIRFLTETDYPPFNFTGPDGNPAGFNVDLARSLCDEIKVTCTIQMRRFETLVDAITSNRGDAIIASLAVTPALRARLDFTDPYYRAPARFVSRRDAVMPEIRPEYLEGKKVGVIAGTSHEAYLKAMFTDAEIKSYPNDDALRLALAAERGRFHLRRRDLRWRSGSTAPIRANAARSRAGPLSRAAISARASASPSARATICCGVAELGAVPALGKRPLHRFVAAVFFHQPVLGVVENP